MHYVVGLPAIPDPLLGSGLGLLQMENLLFPFQFYCLCLSPFPLQHVDHFFLLSPILFSVQAALFDLLNLFLRRS